DHGRPKTAALLDGLEVVPRRRIEYRGVIVEEMDTDAILARRPTVAVVDELAHTNVPGSERPKRYQDVEVLREAGIHVLSTCNVQHLESVADAVATITGGPVNERLPDEVLEGADEVELETNLTALRELSLRFVAQRVDEQLDTLASTAGTKVGAIQSVAERVLVLVDETAGSRKALRRAAHLASALHGPLVAVVITTPSSELRAFDALRDLRENVDFAEDLGADVVQAESSDLVTGLTEVARRRRATQLVLPYRHPGGFAGLTRRSLTDAILERMPELEIHLVAAGDGSPPDR
ncbi:MAG: universal stress protein, partial [Candidatus Limnocylindrales bacterium]